uniref:NAD-dependent epimerase/dehydratase domain-containing protein n=1 Tax=Lotharella oceanica TaxID=641309 RepID=A0A7S2XDM2_9EUKA
MASGMASAYPSVWLLAVGPMLSFATNLASASTAAASLRPLVCVTGASGYVASVLVQTLKDKGYRVRGTVRNVTRYQLEPVFQDVELFAADLVEEGSFDEAFHGCNAIFHCASPFISKYTDPEEELIRPAVEGTLNVLRSAVKAGVPNVVVTSSTAAIGPPQFNLDKLPKDKTFSEEDWNVDSTLEHGAYRLSKRRAEEAAWNFARDHPGLRLSVINPSFVIGPPVLTRASGVSVSTFVNMLNGEMKETGCKGSCFGAVDIRDVAEAHVRALETPAASGKRFLVSSIEGYSQLEFADILRSSNELKGYHPGLPTHLSSPVAYRPRYNRARAEKILGIRFRPIEESVLDMARKLVGSGMVADPETCGN